MTRASTAQKITSGGMPRLNVRPPAEAKLVSQPGGFAGRFALLDVSQMTMPLTTAPTPSVTISGWTLKFTFPGDQKITSAWSGTETQSGENVTITNASYNGTIAPGGNTSLGFQGTWTNSDAVPTAFTVNGTACTT